MKCPYCGDSDFDREDSDIDIMVLDFLCHKCKGFWSVKYGPIELQRTDEDGNPLEWEPYDEAGCNNAAAIALIESWIADDSDYDETTYPALKKALEAAKKERNDNGNV
jgi:hypothetical protein